ncbi:MAG TPA: alpha/beta fold hydrolase [Steroidobacteraceae bacterium]|nr:alpha/beta fold hydrolase [Steroidobacteraceae bacterium]
MPDQPSILIAHGLWMTGVEATLLRRRLAEHGFAVRQFHYRSATAPLPAVIEEFREAVLMLPSPVHLVGHSLGGLLVLRLVEAHPDLPLGRIVLLGSPVNGSESARAFLRMPGAALLFGTLAERELVRAETRAWRHAFDIGVIAGSHALGFGRFIGHLPQPNDGTVAVEETRLEGATDHLVLPVSHTGMLVSESVVRETVAFLATGRFSGAAT